MRAMGSGQLSIAREAWFEMKVVAGSNSEVGVPLVVIRHRDGGYLRFGE